jgi:hypothetical protein
MQTLLETLLWIAMLVFFLFAGGEGGMRQLARALALSPGDTQSEELKQGNQAPESAHSGM